MNDIYMFQIKWRQKRKQTSLTRMALQAISHMETRKYTNDLSRRSYPGTESHQSFDSLYSCNRWPYYDIKSCAICLEEFTEGQVRVFDLYTLLSTNVSVFKVNQLSDFLLNRLLLYECPIVVL